MGIAAPILASTGAIPEPLMYHDPTRSGFAAFLANAGRGWRQRSVRLAELPETLATIEMSQNLYISQNEFYMPNRRLIYAKRLPVVFLDLDTYKVPGLAGLGRDGLCQRFLDTCSDEGIPEPSVVVHSGRGLQVKWVLEVPVPASGVPRWQAVQRELWRRFAHFGADNNALDVSRVLRVEGSTHSTSNTVVEVLHRARIPTGGGILRPDGVVAHSFDLLADELLQFGREALAQLRETAEERRLEWLEQTKVVAARQATQALVRSQMAKRTGTLANLAPFVRSQLAWDRVADVRLLCHLRGWESGVPDGERDKCVFLVACFLAEACLATDIYAELVPLVRELAPNWQHDRIRNCVSSVLQRADAHARGERVEFEGREISPRYGHSNKTLIAMLEINDDEQRQLCTIISKEEKKRRAREKVMAVRRAQGVRPRAEYLQEVGDKRRLVQLLVEQGMSYRAIAQSTGIPRTSVARYAGPA